MNSIEKKKGTVMEHTQRIIQTAACVLNCIKMLIRTLRLMTNRAIHFHPNLSYSILKADTFCVYSSEWKLKNI